jgi:FtsH-binding integral membrane protein
MEENFSPQQSLQLIQSMIDKAKNHFSENGHLYLLWGWVVFFCSVVHFVLLKFVQYEKHYLIWMLTWGAALYQMVYLAKRKKQERVKTYAEHITGYVWLTFVVSMFLMGFVLARGGNAGHYYTLINPVFLALYGIPTFLSGIILQFRPLIIGGIVCWLLSVAGTFVPYEYQLLLLSTAMIVAWIIPGYILRSRFKKNN